MAGRDIFLSHSSDDAEAARELRGILEADGYSCWMAPDDVIGTGTWTEQILAAIKDCAATVVLVSHAANASIHVSREVNLALGRGKPVLPIRIEAVPPEGSLEYLLSLVQRVDAFPPPISAHKDQLLRRLSTIAPTKSGRATPIEPAEPKRASRRTKSTPPSAPPGGDIYAAGIGPGTVLGGFTIEAEIGEGGMATVYRARQAEPDRAVALKVIRADHARDPDYRARFLAEKDTLARLEHPGIVPIYASGDDRGALFIAMRFIDGVDLETRIRNEGRLNVRETADVLRPIADAIDYAHESGVVHHDLKPANVILDRHGRPYLTDFAIGDRPTTDGATPIPGLATGTAAYMAPEQAQGRPPAEIGPAIDVYAFGCMAFACLVGHPPYRGETAEAVLRAHATAPIPSALAERPELPVAVDGLLARALAKEPAARMASAGELATDLELLATSASQGTTQPVVIPVVRTPVERARRWIAANTPVAVIGGALALIILLVGLANILTPPGPKPTATPGATQVAATTTPAKNPPSGGVVRISGDDGVDGVTSSKTVRVFVDTPPTGGPATKYLIANSPVRPTTADAQPYVEDFEWNLDDGDGLAGNRSIYVWFGDDAGNWSATPVTASITFDNPPSIKANQIFVRTGDTWCTDPTHKETLSLVLYLVTDPDVGQALSIDRLWTGGPVFSADHDLSGAIDANRQTVTISLTSPPTAVTTFEDWFTVRDAVGLTATGSFQLSVGPTAPCA